MWRNYYSVSKIEEALEILHRDREHARIVAGNTDLHLEIDRGIRTNIESLVDISRIPDQNKITLDEDNYIHLGPLVTHSQCISSKLIVEHGLPLALAAREVGVPQIRCRGTVAGNLITASPANDTITPLLALDAKVHLKSLVGERIMPLKEFYTGVRQTVMQPDEMLVGISFPAMGIDQQGAFIKIGLRRAQAISVVNGSVVLKFGDGKYKPIHERKVVSASVTLGAVAPTVIHASDAEEYLVGRILDESTMQEAARLAALSARPIDDLRGSKEFRTYMVRVSILRCLKSIREGGGVPESLQEPVTLAGIPKNGASAGWQKMLHHTPSTPIQTRINGTDYTFTTGQHKTLLRLIREEAGLIGTKEGCAEGECGACTVFLDGMAVMSCLVSAIRAHGAEIQTIEGLSVDGRLHPVQQAFIDQGAVQCGYCTPGFIMSAAKLLEERSHPSQDDIKQAISGNLCRCTGYYKIIQAIEQASQ